MRIRAGQALPAVVLAFLFGCGSEPEPVRIGDMAPELALPVLGGGELKNADLRGDVVILNFWATWCAPCLREIPIFKELDEKGVRIVGIALDEEGEKAVRPFVSKHGLGYTQLLGNQEVFTRFNGLTVPYTLVLDAEGRIANLYRGPATLEALLADVAEAVAPEARPATTATEKGT